MGLIYVFLSSFGREELVEKKVPHLSFILVFLFCVLIVKQQSVKCEVKLKRGRDFNAFI